ncbi:putative T7SS-secreted protein [Streptomyces sp. NPDC047081]|uniref:putative T7SS-secreted protein n=1 Tax=Streptomyces sp. NPDC047081 TaxID=3154706 RepID=UPI0033EB32E9
MASALGETTDPKDLIPGDVEKLGDLATALIKWSDKFDGIGDGLGAVRIPGWMGKASDAFWPTLSKEKTNWYVASDAMSGAAKAVTSYSSILSWAQQQAATAIELWEGGQHDSAESMLKSARQQLQHGVEALAKKLGDLAGGASDSPRWLVDARSYVDAKQWTDEHGVGKTNQTWWNWEKQKQLGADDSRWNQSKEWGKDADGNWYIRNKPEQDETGEAGASGRKVETKVKLAEWTGSASVASAGISGETTAGGATLKGAAGVQALGVDGSAAASFGNGRLQAGVSGTAYLAQASANGSVQYGIAGAQAEGKAFAGADANANLSAGKDGLHAGAEAFAGAKATGSVSADVAGVGAGVSGEAWAGAGASASADLGMKDGKFTIGGEAGIGLGLGAKVGFDVTVDPGKLVDSVGDAADAVGDTWDNTVGGWF